MAETKTSISELAAATSVGQNDLLFISQQSGSAWNSKKATVSQLPFGQGTITGITMNGASKGTSGVVDLGTVLTAHQSLTGYYTKAETSSKTQIETALNGKQATGYYVSYSSDLNSVNPAYLTFDSPDGGLTISGDTAYNDFQAGAKLLMKNSSVADFEAGAKLSIQLSDVIDKMTNTTLKAQLDTKAYISALTGYSLTSHNHSGTYAPATHAHGNIQSGGTLQTTDITIAIGDKLVVTDSSDSSKVARTSLAFDGSTTTQFLSKKGTFETALTAHQSLDSCLKNSEDQTISGCNRLFLMSGTLDSTVVPVSSVQSPGLSLQDKNAYTVGQFMANRNNSGRQAMLIRVRQPINGSDSTADIGLCIDADNTKYAYCPTPPASSNDTKIATTAWVRSRMSGDYVSKSALTAAVAAVGTVPSGDGATLSAVIDKYNALVTALTALAT